MVIDIICAIVAAYGFYLGFTKGIIKTIFTLISIFFGILAAAKFGPTMTDFLQSTFSYNHSMMFLAGMLLTFVLTMMFIRTLARGLENCSGERQYQYHQPIGGRCTTFDNAGKFVQCIDSLC